MKKINQNDENLGKMAEELRKYWEEVALQQKVKKAEPVVIFFSLSARNDLVFNDSLKFIFIFTF